MISKNEIGSLFEYYSDEKKDLIFRDFDNILYLRTAREALKLIAQNAKKNGIQSVFLPIYCCNSIIQPFKEEEFIIYFYNISAQFEAPNCFFENTNLENCIVLIINYFGKRCYSSDFHKTINKYKNTITILDCTQSLFDSNLYDNDFDYQIGSIRKWLAIPDGAFLIYKYKPAESIQINYGNNKFLENYFLSMRMKSNYLINKDLNTKKIFLDLYRQSVAFLKGPISIYLMSEVSRRILNNYDFSSLKCKRRNNYHYLCNGLRAIPYMTDIIDFNPDVPFCVVLLVKNRDEIQLELSNRGIYCQVLWPMSNDNKVKSEYWSYVSDHILCIPCDQRYGKKDMNYILKNLKDVFGNV